MKIAWFTPFAKSSAIGKYGALFVDELAKNHDVTVFVDGLKNRKDAWRQDHPMYFLAETPMADILALLPAFDAVFYNLGDHDANHTHIYNISQQHPGIVILHDLVMHHFFYNYYLIQREDRQGFLNELVYSHGAEGAILGEKILNGSSGNIWVTRLMLDFNMALSAIRGAYGIVTHSPYSTEFLSHIAPAPNVYIPFPSPPLPDNLKPTAQKDSNTLKLLSFGVVNPNKMIAEIIEAIGKAPALHSQIRYDIIGSADGTPAYFENLQNLVKHYNLDKQVVFHGYQSDNVLYQYMANADVVVNMRNPHFGESSASLVESMFMGKATIVWNHGHYACFPDDTVFKVDSVTTLITLLGRLTQNKSLTQVCGQTAKAYIESHLITARSTQQLVAFAEAIRKEKIVFEVTDFIITEMKRMGASDRFPHFNDTIIKTLSELIE